MEFGNYFQMSDQPSEIELYSIFVDTITAAEQRRQQISSIYYSLLIAVFAFLGSDIKISSIYLTLPLSLISLIFFAKIQYFRNLATAKFAVIETLEKDWDVKPFEIEWNEFKNTRKFKFSGFLTGLEALTPLLVAIVAFGYSVYSTSIFLFNAWCNAQ